MMASDLPISGTRFRSSLWCHLSMCPVDVAFELPGVYKNYEIKYDMLQMIGIKARTGVYRNDDGSPFVFPTVRKVEEELISRHLDKEYAGILGLRDFRSAVLQFLLGSDCTALTNDKCAIAQTIGGTCALRVIATFLQKHFPYDKTMYTSENTWPNHAPIFQDAGFNVKTFCYYNWSTGGLDSEGLYNDLKSIPSHSVVLLQACGHNPTGVDPNIDEWKEISKICKEKCHFVVIDSAYQGYASGCVDEDMKGVRRLVNDGNSVAICHTFSKNMGLYGERVGTATIVCSSNEERKIVESHMKLVIRPMYSSPSIHGARIATEILTNPQYKEKWLKELKQVYENVQSKRVSFHAALVNSGSTKDWSHILAQKGWYCFTGINEEQVQKLQDDYNIYMSKTRRVTIVALRAVELQYLANSIHGVSK